MTIKVIYDDDFKVKYFSDIQQAEKFAKEVGTELVIKSSKPTKGSFGQYASKKGTVS